ncbi:UDP-glycosyltransferase UGT5-like [Diprion similis]|uniref:UDP-glycosyltransferase UGT5-like n=1 Tax=Diprion similis TaxID=362088 RepID=UPI001EF86C8C|nr:UDP-glycosyltransferase UGT5-like [Diprion similis]
MNENAAYFITLALILAVRVFHQGSASRILGIFPMPSISHQVVFRGLTTALRDRGHELIVITPDPINDPTLKNYTEIDISFLYADFTKDMDWIATRDKGTWFEVFRSIAPRFTPMSERVLNHPDVKKLYSPNSGEKFDLLIIEMLYWHTFLSLAKYLDVPVIGVTSLSMPLQMQYGIGNPVMPSHPAHWDAEIKVLGKLSLCQRLWNFVYAWRFLHYYRTVYLRGHQEISRKYFGSELPDIADIEKNISLVFVNQQAPILFVRPNLPKMIDIGGFQRSKKIEPLSKNLQKTLDDATQGFIYMSLGTNVKSVMLSNETRKEFLATFSQLPYTVIWKFENENLPGRPDNVIIMKWAPQQSILAHPNIKAFIYQGGLQSTEEAISHVVPVIGLPVFADQDTQVNKMVSLGVGKKLEIVNINRMDLVDAIDSVVRDDSYKQRMLKLRDLMRDKPHDSLENAVWWTEHVIRHKGAPHLHSSIADDPWYQRQDMDLIFIISIAIWTALIITLVVLYKLLRHSIHVLKYQLLVSKEKKVC